MTKDELELSRQLTDLVRSLPGVNDVYTTGGLVAATTMAVTNLFDDEARVAVEGDQVSASIAVSAGFSAPEILHAASAAIADHLASTGHAPMRISVTASRIE
jgi:hypothetical protein